MASGKIAWGATVTTGTWIPQLYDNNDYIRDLDPAKWWKIGPIYILRIDQNAFAEPVTINTMLQIRNTPCGILGGQVYCNWFQNQGAELTIQQTEASRVYFRPNYTGTFGNAKFQAFLIGM